MIQNNQGSIDYKSEIMRKTIHLCSLSIPIIYFFITEELALSILIPLTLIFLIMDFGRYLSPALGKFIYSIFGFMMRVHEKDHDKKNLSGATYVFISAVVSMIILPKEFFITGFTALILCDIAAALIGRRFGRHKFLAKSLEGTFAFFVVGCILIFFTPKIAGVQIEYFIGFMAIAVGAIGENLSYGWADDNLVIPISIGLSMWALYAIFLPEISAGLSSPLLTFFN